MLAKPVLAVRLFSWWFLALCCAACSNEQSQNPVATAAPSVTSSGSPSAASSAKSKPPQPLLDGAPLYEKYCALCHGKEGKGYAADNAPSLVSQTFLESASTYFIARGIRMGRPGTAMAAYAKRYGGPLEEPEIQAIVRFLREKGPQPKALPTFVADGDPEAGKRVFEKSCASCHGSEGQRGKAPMLFNAEFLTAANPAFLHYAIVHGRPPTEMAAFGGTLSDAEIKDVVTFLSSKRKGYQPPRPEVDPKDLVGLPVVIHPKGPSPSFELREGRFVSIEQVKKALDAKNRIVIIDARAASDFVRGHIPGAIVNSYFDKAGLDRVPKDGTWVVAYCACPHHASGEVVDELRRRGYPHTAVLDEGILEWERRGYPMAEWTPHGEVKNGEARKHEPKPTPPKK